MNLEKANELRAACANLLMVVEGMKIVANGSAHMFGNGYRAALDGLRNSQAFADISRIIAAPETGNCQPKTAAPQPAEESAGEALCPSLAADFSCDCSPHGERCLESHPDRKQLAICTRPRWHSGPHRACSGDALTRREWA